MSDLTGLVLTFLPLFIILLLANAAERARRRDLASAAATAEPVMLTDSAEAGSITTAVAPKRDDTATIFKVMAYLSIVSIYLLVVFAAIALLATQALGRARPELGLADLMGNVASPALVAWGLLLPALAGIALLLPAVRRLCARFIPIDSDSPVHAVSLSMTMLVIISMLLTLGVGLSNISAMVTEAQKSGAGVTTYVSVWGQQVLMALLGFVGIGWLLRRNLRQSTDRLGLVWPTFRQVLIGIGLAIVMVFVVTAIQAVASWLGFAGDADVDELTEQLLGPLFNSPWGVITLGLAAALGEETLIRGAAQPRLGLILTAALFALLHSNYGITLSTAVVFLLGLVLGIVRIRQNTTTSMVLHTTYNMILGLMAYLSVDLLQQISK